MSRLFMKTLVHCKFFEHPIIPHIFNRVQKNCTHMFKFTKNIFKESIVVSNFHTFVWFCQAHTMPRMGRIELSKLTNWSIIYSFTAYCSLNRKHMSPMVYLLTLICPHFVNIAALWNGLGNT